MDFMHATKHEECILTLCKRASSVASLHKIANLALQNQMSAPLCSIARSCFTKNRNDRSAHRYGYRSRVESEISPQRSFYGSTDFIGPIIF